MVAIRCRNTLLSSRRAGKGGPLMEHRYRMKVRFSECDMYGHVNHAAYLSFLENARIDLLEKIDQPLERLTAAGISLFVVKITIEYKKPAFFNDVLEVISSSEQNSRIGGTFIQRIMRGKELVAEAAVKWVCVDESGRPRKLPEGIEKVLGNANPGKNS